MNRAVNDLEIPATPGETRVYQFSNGVSHRIFNVTAVNYVGNEQLVLSYSGQTAINTLIDMDRVDFLQITPPNKEGK